MCTNKKETRQSGNICFCPSLKQQHNDRINEREYLIKKTHIASYNAFLIVFQSNDTSKHFCTASTVQCFASLKTCMEAQALPNLKMTYLLLLNRRNSYPCSYNYGQLLSSTCTLCLNQYNNLFAILQIIMTVSFLHSYKRHYFTFT